MCFTFDLSVNVNHNIISSLQGQAKMNEAYCSLNEDTSDFFD
jgi:hypothetical protein